jgi:hypothetical protein
MPYAGQSLVVVVHWLPNLFALIYVKNLISKCLQRLASCNTDELYYSVLQCSHRGLFFRTMVRIRTISKIRAYFGLIFLQKVRKSLFLLPAPTYAVQVPKTLKI